jgi:serine/threonine protein kinase
MQAAYSESSIGGKRRPARERNASKAGRGSAEAEPRIATAGISTPPALVELDEFRRGAVGLRLVSEQQFDWYSSTVHGSVSDLSRVLVRAGKLTAYQAGALAQGKAKGLVVGDYLILDKLGTGGMGVVFKASRRRDGRVVALKLLPPSFGRDRDAVLRFQREFEVAARLCHVNVVSALEAVEDRGVHCITMEYIDGHDLDRLVLAGGPLTVKQALNCVTQAARGLEAAHAAGIVHRDIKPANLMLDASGTVKLLDLGLARLVAANSPFGQSTKNNLTQSRMCMGTVDYMAPEQADDPRKVDQRADLYSLGCTLFFLLTGRPPFEGETTIKVIIAHHERPAPSLLAVRPTTPAAIDAAYEKMMAKRPSDRPQSATALIALLESCQTSADEEDEARWGLRTFADTVMKRAVPRNPDRVPSIFASVREPGPLEFDPNLKLEDVITGYHPDTHPEPLTEDRLPPRTWTPDPPLTRRQARRVREAWFLGAAALGVVALIAIGFITAINVWRRVQRPSRPLIATIEAKVVPIAPALNPKPASPAKPSEPRRIGPGPTDPEASDSLSRDDIAPYELLTAGHGDPSQAPAQLVHIIGDSRLHSWSAPDSMAFNPDGKSLITGGSDGVATIWDVSTGKPTRAIETDVKSGGVRVAVSPDGQLFATVGSAMGSIPQVWETATGRKRRPLRAEGLRAFLDHYRTLAFSPAGRLLAAAGSRAREAKAGAFEQNGIVTIWDLGTGLPVWTNLTEDRFRPSPFYFSSVELCFDPEGKTLYGLAVLSELGTQPKTIFRAWETQGGREIATGLDLSANRKHNLWYWQSSRPAASNAQFCRDAHSLIYGVQKPVAKLDPNKFPPRAAEEWYIFDLGTRRSTSVPLSASQHAFAGIVGDLSPDGKTLCLWSFGPPAGIVFVDMATGATRRSIGSVEGAWYGSGCVYSPDGSKLARIHGGIEILDVKADKDVIERGRFAGGVRSIGFGPDGKWLAIAVVDGVVLWDPTTRTEHRFFQGALGLCALSADGRSLALYRDGKVKIVDTSTAKEKVSIETSPSPDDSKNRRSVAKLALSPDGRAIACGYQDGGVEFRDAKSGAVRRSYKIGATQLSSVAISPDGHRIAASVRVSSSRPVPESLFVELHTKLKPESVLAKRYANTHPDTSNCMVVVWDLESGDVVREFPWVEGSLSFDPTGQSLATGPFDDGYRDILPIWDASTGQLRLLLEGHKSGDVSAAFARDGATITTWSGDGTVRLWDSATGSQKELIRLCPKNGQINQVAFSPTGRYLATANGNGTAYILRPKLQ